MSKSIKMLCMIDLLMGRVMSINDIANRFKVSTRTVKRYLVDINNSSLMLVKHQGAANTAARYSIVRL